MKRTSLAALLAGAALLVSACGGGTTVAGGGTGGTGSVAYGTVTALGSVWVNGVHWLTDGATIEADGTEYTGTEAPGGGVIEKGKVVTVYGTRDAATAQGTATHVIYRANLVGVVSNYSAANGTFTVLGQTVLLEPGMTVMDDDPTTVSGTPPVYDPNAATPQVAGGNWVEVSGFPDANGQIRARYVGVGVAGSVYKLTGYVESVNGTGDQFTLTNGLTIHYSAGSVTVAPDQYVEVRASADVSGTDLTANEVEIIGTAASGVSEIEFEGNEFEIEAVVSHVTGGNTLWLAGHPVRFDTAVFAGGLPADMAPGAYIEAEGRVVNGQLIAQEVEFKDGFEVRGRIAAVNTATGEVSFEGALPTVTYGGDLSGFTAGQFVRAEGRQTTVGGALTASRLTLTYDGVRFEGPFQGADATTMTVAGFAVTDQPVSGGFYNYYLDDDQPPVSRDTFITRVPRGAKVKFTGTYVGSEVIWTSVEYDD